MIACTYGFGVVNKGAPVLNCGSSAPPGNKPAIDEIRACRPYFERELDLLPRIQVVIALGKLAFDVYLGVLAYGPMSSKRCPGSPRNLKLR